MHIYKVQTDHILLLKSHDGMAVVCYTFEDAYICMIVFLMSSERVRK